MRNDYEPNYLAHSKGPWKDHIYTAKKFINGKWRYIYGVASNTMSKAKAKAKRTGANLKNKAYAAPYLAKAYKTKARFAVKDAKKAISKKVTSYKNKRLANKAIKNYGKASGMSAQMKADKKARKQRERLNERNLRAARKKLKQQRKKNPNYGRSYTYTDSNGKRKTKVGYGKKSRRWTNNMRRIKDIHSVSTGSYT